MADNKPLTITDADIYRAAKQLVHYIEDDAAMNVAINAAACIRQGAQEDRDVWLRILRAVAELQQDRQRNGEATH